MKNKIKKEIARVVIKKELYKKEFFNKFLKINTYKNISENEIILYFYGTRNNTYQINQWIDTFIELNKKHKIIIVVRNIRVYMFWRNSLPFDIYFASSLNDVLVAYKKVDPKIILYINNGVKNFQSLIYEDAMHIHINHGESDKSSDHSNQVKSYDYIFVHGPNGYNNYKKYLINLNSKKLVQTGRPQLDFIKPISIETYDKKVIIYAPTWEATHISMNYTSVHKYGVKLVSKILKESEYFLIYKPHPSLGINNNDVKLAHNEILNMVKTSKFAMTITNTDINNIYPIVDFAIFDMSSIMTDYLHINKPFVLADVFNKDVHTVTDYNVLEACTTININNIDNIITIIENEIKNDTLKKKREEIKNLYLGNYKKGESIIKFIDTISNIIIERDIQVEQKYNLEKGITYAK